MLNAPPDGMLNIALSISKALSKVAALKNTHAQFTNINVKNQLTYLLIFQLLSLNNLSITEAIPCKSPQNTNVHAAPCHKPLTKKVNNKFIYVLTLPFLFPPSGLYTYVDNALPKVICHLLQNSDILVDLYGDKKFVNKVSAKGAPYKVGATYLWQMSIDID